MHSTSVVRLFATGLVAAAAVSGFGGPASNGVSRTIGALVAVAGPALSAPITEYEEIEERDEEVDDDDEDDESSLEVRNHEVEDAENGKEAEAVATPEATPAAKQDKKKGKKDKKKDKKKGKKNDKKKGKKNDKKKDKKKAQATPTPALA